MFLWHYPHGYPHWELPSKPDHLGARTFLKKVLFCFQNKTFLRLPLLLSFSIVLNTKNLIFSYLKHPLMTFKIISAIHFEALRLWLKGIKLVKKKVNIKNNISYEK